jgi:hypothetical protein
MALTAAAAVDNHLHLVVELAAVVGQAALPVLQVLHLQLAAHTAEVPQLDRLLEVVEVVRRLGLIMLQLLQDKQFRL